MARRTMCPSMARQPSPSRKAIVQAGVKKESWAKPMDAVLEKVAVESGGIYDPQHHLRSLESRSVVAGGVSVTPDAIVDANVRRLQRLARHELVAELPDGRWQVPTDLVSQLRRARPPTLDCACRSTRSRRRSGIR